MIPDDPDFWACPHAGCDWTSEERADYEEHKKGHDGK